jgi:hypothetical protein
VRAGRREGDRQQGLAGDWQRAAGGRQVAGPAAAGGRSQVVRWALAGGVLRVGSCRRVFDDASRVADARAAGKGGGSQAEARDRVPRRAYQEQVDRQLRAGG